MVLGFRDSSTLAVAFGFRCKGLGPWVYKAGFMAQDLGCGVYGFRV
jgi:hypothetical protein